MLGFVSNLKVQATSCRLLVRSTISRQSRTENLSTIRPDEVCTARTRIDMCKDCHCNIFLLIVLTISRTEIANKLNLNINFVDLKYRNKCTACFSVAVGGL